MMKPVKSERLRKLESEYNDLEHWLQLGLVPKKDIPKHKEEIQALKEKIDEEKERLQFLKEGGEAEDFVIPKRGANKAAYSDMPTLPDVDIAESSSGITESGFDMDTYITEETAEEGEGDVMDDDAAESEAGTVAKAEEEEEEDESYFSEKNRWRRGGIVDPDADEW